jgi:hypothetical protein
MRATDTVRGTGCGFYMLLLAMSYQSIMHEKKAYVVDFSKFPKK